MYLSSKSSNSVHLLEQSRPLLLRLPVSARALRLSFHYRVPALPWVMNLPASPCIYWNIYTLNLTYAFNPLLIVREFCLLKFFFFSSVMLGGPVSDLYNITGREIWNIFSGPGEWRRLQKTMVLKYKYRLCRHCIPRCSYDNMIRHLKIIVIRPPW